MKTIDFLSKLATFELKDREVRRDSFVSGVQFAVRIFDVKVVDKHRITSHHITSQ